MTAPGTILLAKIIVPETQHPLTAGRVEMPPQPRDSNVLAALARGATDGLKLALNVAAMLTSFIAIIYLCDGLFGKIHGSLVAHGFLWFPMSLEQILGWVFSPVAWLIGIPWHDCPAIGHLLGLRMVTNELIAFQRLGPMRASLDSRSFTIATFALCGFANLSSIGIQIGGIGALAPNQKQNLARLGFRAMLAGTLANLMSASIVGIFLR
jgi:CNT family concentrative nucleoside transporter